MQTGFTGAMAKAKRWDAQRGTKAGKLITETGKWASLQFRVKGGTRARFSPVKMDLLYADCQAQAGMTKGEVDALLMELVTE